jgi:ectoine hydroxylase-related dioxygenase (phytanoyl-CoA dioxygenase family)
LFNNFNNVNDKLTGENARQSDVYQEWEQDNQAWWDWYVSLAENKSENDKVSELFSLPDIPKLSKYEIYEELKTPYVLNLQQINQFKIDGYIKIKNILSPGAILSLRNELKKLLNNFFLNKASKSKRNFLSMDLLWTTNSFIKEYVLSSRIAGVIGQLLEVNKVRLYHDNILSKEPGCGRTPWHYDAHHFPLATNNVVTAWIPAQPIPKTMGPLAFAKPINTYKLVNNLVFDKFDISYDKAVSECFNKNKVAIDDDAFEMGEVSFHHNLCFHTASANNTNLSRIVLANTYFEDGTRVVEKPTMVSGDWKRFIPGVAPGQLASSSMNPICWCKEDT